MKELKKILVVVSLVFFTLSPAFAHGAALPPNDGPGGGQSTGLTYECVDSAGVYGNCTFTDLLLAVQKFFKVAIPIAIGFSVIVIAYVGFEYMTSGANPAARSRANGRMVKIAIGIFFMAAAWLIVTLILNALTNPCPKGTNGVDCVPQLLN